MWTAVDFMLAGVLHFVAENASPPRPLVVIGNFDSRRPAPPGLPAAEPSRCGGLSKNCLTLALTRYRRLGGPHECFGIGHLREASRTSLGTMCRRSQNQRAICV